jgi:hypothetical protein
MGKGREIRRYPTAVTFLPDARSGSRIERFHTARVNERTRSRGRALRAERRRGRPGRRGRGRAGGS